MHHLLQTHELLAKIVDNFQRRDKLHMGQTCRRMWVVAEERIGRTILGITPFARVLTIRSNNSHEYNPDLLVRYLPYIRCLHFHYINPKNEDILYPFVLASQFSQSQNPAAIRYRSLHVLFDNLFKCGPAMKAITELMRLQPLLDVRISWKSGHLTIQSDDILTPLLDALSGLCHLAMQSLYLRIEKLSLARQRKLIEDGAVIRLVSALESLLKKLDVYIYGAGSRLPPPRANLAELEDLTLHDVPRDT